MPKLDRNDVVLLVAFGLVSGGAWCVWSVGIAAMVLGVLLLVLAWPRPSRSTSIQGDR